METIVFHPNGGFPALNLSVTGGKKPVSHLPPPGGWGGTTTKQWSGWCIPGPPDVLLGVVSFEWEVFYKRNLSFSEPK